MKEMNGKSFKSKTKSINVKSKIVSAGLFFFLFFGGIIGRVSNIPLMHRLGGSGLWADVKIVRKLPETSTNKVEAKWSAPRPKIENEEVFLGKTKFSGRLSLGGSGGQDVVGTVNYDFFTDSRFTLFQPLGSVGAIQMSGSAFRKNIIGGLLQKYGGSFVFKLTGLSFKFNGLYDGKAIAVEDILKDETKLLLDASLNILYLPTLPISIAYSHRIGSKKDDPNTTNEVRNEDTESDEAKLSVSGNIGSLGVNLSSGFASQRDKLNSVNNTGFSNNVSVTLPLFNLFKAVLSISPDYSIVEYPDTNNKVSTTTLDSSLGAIFPFGTDLSFDIYGGRLDTWLTREGPDAGTVGVDYEPYSAAWTGSTGIEYKNDSGFRAKSGYELKAGTNLFNQKLSAYSGFKGKDKTFIRNIYAKGELDQGYIANWVLSSNKISWAAGAKVSPLDKMILSSDYNGSVSDSTSWVHSVKAAFSHTPDPMLDYQLNASLSDSITGTANSIKQGYGGKISLKPQWNLKLYSFELGEQVALSGSAGGANDNPAEAVVSTMTYGMGIPIFSFLKTRYNLKWEWTNDTGDAGNSTSGNNFQHLFGVTVSGSPIPLTFTTDYLFSHGYRGFRHDVNSSLSVPIWGAFALESRFSLSYYEENGSWKLPFLFGMNASYQF